MSQLKVLIHGVMNYSWSDVSNPRSLSKWQEVRLTTKQSVHIQGLREKYCESDPPVQHRDKMLGSAL